jgi:hypothetical protein
MRFSREGISVRVALVAVEVVYHHCFFVFGQRSVYDGSLVEASFLSVKKQSYRISTGVRVRREREMLGRSVCNLNETYLSVKKLLETC